MGPRVRGRRLRVPLRGAATVGLETGVLWPPGAGARDHRRSRARGGRRGVVRGLHAGGKRTADCRVVAGLELERQELKDDHESCGGCRERCDEALAATGPGRARAERLGGRGLVVPSLCPVGRESVTALASTAALASRRHYRRRLCGSSVHRRRRCCHRRRWCGWSAPPLLPDPELVLPLVPLETGVPELVLVLELVPLVPVVTGAGRRRAAGVLPLEAVLTGGAEVGGGAGGSRRCGWCGRAGTLRRPDRVHRMLRLHVLGVMDHLRVDLGLQVRSCRGGPLAVRFELAA